MAVTRSRTSAWLKSKPDHWAYYEIMEASIGHRADLSAGVEVWAETDAPRYPFGPVSVGTELY